jgi:CO/xanthine dehydrogenase Mo-binding subunit
VQGREGSASGCWSFSGDSHPPTPPRRSPAPAGVPEVTSLDWVSYPILRFKDAPRTTVVVVNRPDVPPRGGGEETHEPTPAAIANAFFDATGVRIRRAPMTPPVVRETLRAAGAT